MLEYPFKLISRITGYFDKLWVLRPGFSLYDLFSFFLLVGVFVFFLAGLPQLLSSGNPLIEYGQGPFLYSGHWLSWIALITVIAVVGYFDIIKGLYAAAMIYGFHEMIWLIADSYALNTLAVLTHFWPLIAVLAFLIIGYFVNFRSFPAWKEIAIVASIVVFDLVWLHFGWEVSVQNFYAKPQTIYFTNGAVNLQETAGWLIPALIALLPTTKTLKRGLINIGAFSLIIIGLVVGVIGPVNPSSVPYAMTVLESSAAALLVYALILGKVLKNSNIQKPPDLGTSPL